MVTIEKIIKTQIDECLDVAEVSLLSEDEYNKYKDFIPRINKFWWLKSIGEDTSCVADVDPDGTVLYDSVVSNDREDVVRPVLKVANLKALDLHPGDKIKGFVGLDWTVISDAYIICDGHIGYYHYRKAWQSPDAYDYEKSDAKKYLEDWWETKSIK